MKRRNRMVAALACLLLALSGCGQNEETNADAQSEMKAVLEEQGISMYEDVVSSDGYEASYSKEIEGNGDIVYTAEYSYASSDELLEGAREYVDYLYVTLDENAADTAPEDRAEEVEAAIEEMFGLGDTEGDALSIATGNAFLALGGAMNDQEGVYILRNLVYVPEVKELFLLRLQLLGLNSSLPGPIIENRMDSVSFLL